MNLLENMSSIKIFVDKLQSESFSAMFKLLQERVEYPESFVTMLGETSSGKSSLINGLLGQEVIYTSARPTTGTIVELYEYDIDEKITPYAIMRNAKLRKLSDAQFHEQCLLPNEDVLRLRLHVPVMPRQLQGMRLFDTPGYGSIHDKHQEVLTQFVPNSDVIIYVVNYRVGIGEADAEFLQYISDYLQEELTCFLVINRVPEGITDENVRIKEIIAYAKDLLHVDIKHFLVQSISGNEAKLPEAPDLWDAVRNEIQSPERQQLVNEVLLNYQIQLIQDIQLEWQKKVVGVRLSDESIQQVQQEIEELKDKQKEAYELIHKTFNGIEMNLKRLFESANYHMGQSISSEIKNANKWTSAEECIGYTSAHLMPRYEKLERRKITDYIDQELTILNEKLNELINQAFINFTKNIEIISNDFEPIIEGFSKKIATKTTDTLLKSFLSKFGGRGGAGAGVANLGKKVMKKAGDLMNKKFTRDQYNQLAKVLKKVGATSTRNLTIAVTIVLEGAFYIFEANRWQGRLLKDVQKALNTWQKETIKEVQSDMAELRQTNIEIVEECFDELISTFDHLDNTLEIKEIDAWQEEIDSLQDLINDMTRG
ncbi:dynamin family protein [Planococcus sp. YIM B11945]|uniref:dynamin family protein n=1 Tax=Planococcus sp. YIM B11945 TaxID=3435410 RepID=UPI003D7E9D15